MDVFCLTSKYEGFGLVLLEAMQSELPIIAANNSAISEVLGHGYPYLFTTSDTADLLEKMELLTSERHRKDAIAYLQERLKKFSPFVMATKIDSIYMECLNQIPQNKSL
jgi:glycosyltransferase involved in cell wall biosynthesis